jgi:DNA-binding PadR family transcriptional regulator
MIKSEDLPVQHSATVVCALISCAVFHGEFRSSDVIFWDELFRDALQYREQKVGGGLHPVQIDRILVRLKEFGYAAVNKIGPKKIYAINIKGVVALVSHLVPADRLLPLDETLLIQYFLTTYDQLLRDLVRQKGDDELLASLDQLLTGNRVFKGQKELLETMIQASQKRIAASQSLIKHIEEQINRGVDFDEIHHRLPSEFSYNLSYRKGFKDLLKVLPADFRRQEFEHGFKKRKELFYEKHLYVQLQYLELLKEMMTNTPSLS